jgi:hypothetical protein
MLKLAGTFFMPQAQKGTMQEASHQDLSNWLRQVQAVE